MNIAVIGAGIIGRLIALSLLRRGHSLTLWDQGDRSGIGTTSWVAAGMLCPYAEAETAHQEVVELGCQSLALWPQWLKTLPVPVTFQQSGSWLIAHPKDRTEFHQFIIRLKSQVSSQKMQWLSSEAIQKLEPELPQWGGGLYFPTEGHLDTSELMQALTQTLLQAGVEWRDHTQVEAVFPFEIQAQGKRIPVDWVFDTRGLQAKDRFPELRGVRGELFWLDAPEVRLTRPVRVLHPRYRIYVVPRQGGRYVVGATELESEDMSPMSVKSALELLSLVYNLHSGFAEARIVQMLTQCRPALPNHLPRILYEPGYVGINGLYRHGYLLAPIVVEKALAVFQNPEGVTESWIVKSNLPSP